MKKLTKKEEKLLNRYNKSSKTLERFLLFKQSVIASNKLLTILEETLRREELTVNDYVYLKKVSLKKARNYEKLTGTNEVISIFSRIKIKSLEKLKLEIQNE